MKHVIDAQTQHRPRDSDYYGRLIGALYSAGLLQYQLADLIGIQPRRVRHMQLGTRECTYPEQLALELVYRHYCRPPVDVGKAA